MDCLGKKLGPTEAHVDTGDSNNNRSINTFDSQTNNDAERGGGNISHHNKRRTTPQQVQHIPQKLSTLASQQNAKHTATRMEFYATHNKRWNIPPKHRNMHVLYHTTRVGRVPSLARDTSSQQIPTHQGKVVQRKVLGVPAAARPYPVREMPRVVACSPGDVKIYKRANQQERYPFSLHVDVRMTTISDIKPTQQTTEV